MSMSSIVRFSRTAAGAPRPRRPLASVALLLGLCGTVARAQAPAIRLVPSSVSGGASARLEISLPTPAPAGGLPLTITSSRPETAGFGGLSAGSLQTTVPAGRTTHVMTIATAGVATTTPVTIAVTGGPVQLRSTLTVTPAKVSALTIQPASGIGGPPRTGTVSLDGLAAPGEGTVVQLLLAATDVAAVPVSVAVPPGARSVTFPIATRPVARDVALSVTGRTADGAGAKAAFSVTPPTLRALTLTPASVLGGGGFSGVVQLDGAAPVGGLSVAFSVSPASGTVMPADLVIPAQAMEAAFTVTALRVPARVDAVLTATVRDRSPASSVTAPLSVLPLSVAAVTSSVPHVFGGESIDLTLQLTGVPTRDEVIPLRVESSAGAVPVPLPIPERVTVPAGTDRVVVRWATPVVERPVEVRVVAGAATVAPGVANSVRVGLHARPRVKGITVTPSPIRAAETFDAMVQLEWPPGPAFSTPPSLPISPVALTASSLVSASPPLGAAHLQSEVKTPLRAGLVTVPTSVTLTARSGTSEFSRTVTIVPPPIVVTSLTLAPTRVLGGRAASGVVRLSRPADSTGLMITLGAASSAVRVPTSVQAPAGATQVTFPLETRSVEVTQSVVVTASAPGTPPATAALQVNPLGVASIGTNATAVYGGEQPVVATIVLEDAAPAVGATVLVATALPGVVTIDGRPLPLTVRVPSGGTSTTIKLLPPAVVDPALLGLTAQVIPSSTDPAATTANGLAVVSAPSVQVVPLPRGLLVQRFLAQSDDAGRVLGTLQLEFVVANATQIPASLAGQLPPLRFVLKTDHPELVGDDSVLFVPGTGTYERILRGRSVKVSDVPVRAQVRGPRGDESPWSPSTTLLAPRVLSAEPIPNVEEVSGGTTVTVVAHLTHAAGPDGVQGSINGLGGLPETLFAWPPGSDQTQLRLPTPWVAYNMVRPIIEVKARTASVGGVVSRRPLFLGVRGTGVSMLGTVQNPSNPATAATLLAGETIQLVATLRNPAPAEGATHSVVFTSTSAGLTLNEADSAIVATPPSGLNAVVMARAATLPTIPAMARPVNVKARALFEVTGVGSTRVFVIPPPNLRSVETNLPTVRSGRTVTVTVQTTPISNLPDVPPRSFRIPVTSSHPSVVPSVEVALPIDGTFAAVNVPVGVVTEPTVVTLSATVAGKTVSTTVSVVP
jgi:hypothetical protein